MGKRTSISLTEYDLQAIREAIERAQSIEGIRYLSPSEFVRDALRRRVEAINEAWRSTRHLPEAPPRPPRKRGEQ